MKEPVGELAQRVGKNTLFLTVSQVINKVISFLFLIYMTRVLGATGIGKYSFVFAITSVFFLIAIFGITNLQIREVSSDKSLANKFFVNSFLIRLSFSVAAFLTILAMTTFLPYEPDTLSALRIFGFAIIFNALTVSFTDLFIAFERLEYYSLLLVFNNLLTTAAGILVLINGYGLVGLCWVYAVGWIMTFLFGYLLMRRLFFQPKWEPDFRFALWMIKTSWPFALSGLTYFIFFKIDTVILFAMKGAAATGWYSVAYRILEALVFLPQSFVIAMYPSLSQLYKTSAVSLNDVVEKAFRYLLVLSLPFTIGGFFVAKGLVRLVFTSEFDNSALALKILIWSFVFFAIREGFIQLLNAIEKQKVNFYIDLAALIFNVALNLLLIPAFSYIGASIVTLVSYVVVVVVSFLAYARFIGNYSLVRVVFKPLISSAILAGFLLMARGYLDTVPLILAGGTVYVISLFLLGIVDLQVIKGLCALNR